MPAPENEWEHLQSLILRYQNQVVRDEFNDVGPLSWDQDPDITIPRGSLRWGCTLKDDDTVDMTIIRLWLFYGIMRKASDFHPPIYSIPATTFQESVDIYPHVKLHFSQDMSAVPDGDSPIVAEISYRLMRETATTMTEAKARAIALEIKNTFGTGGGYTWRKGKTLCTYRRQEQGYNMQVYALNETEGREVIGKVLSLNEHTLDNDFLTVHDPKRSNTITSATQLIYGKQRKKKRWRPTATVRFRYASLKLDGLPNDVILYDRTGYWRNVVAS